MSSMFVSVGLFGGMFTQLIKKKGCIDAAQFLASHAVTIL